MKPSLVGRRSSQPNLALSISREAYTFISYQGQRPSRARSPAVDLEASEAGGPKRRIAWWLP